MILQAILVGLVAGYGRIEQSWFGQQMIARPIWLCTLVGLLLGDLKQGVIIGGTLELIWAVSFRSGLRRQRLSAAACWLRRWSLPAV